MVYVLAAQVQGGMQWVQTLALLKEEEDAVRLVQKLQETTLGVTGAMNPTLHDWREATSIAMNTMMVEVDVRELTGQALQRRQEHDADLLAMQTDVHVLGTCIPLAERVVVLERVLLAEHRLPAIDADTLQQQRDVEEELAHLAFIDMPSWGDRVDRRCFPMRPTAGAPSLVVPGVAAPAAPPPAFVLPTAPPCRQESCCLEHAGLFGVSHISQCHPS